MDAQVDLSTAECTEFLGTGGTGVLALGTKNGDPPYAIPVSYGYDGQNEQLYFRLATGPDRGKGRVTDRQATFVTFAVTKARWTSVIAKGVLEETTRSEIAVETLDGLERVFIPYIDMFGESLQDVEFTFVRLDPETLDGRTEAFSSA